MKVRRAHLLPVESFRLRRARHGWLPWLHHGDRIKGAAPPQQFVISAERREASRAIPAHIPDHHDPAGMRIGQGLEENGVHGAEDRRARADAQRQRKGADGGKARPLPQGAQRIAGVLPQVLQPAPEAMRPGHSAPPSDILRMRPTASDNRRQLAASVSSCARPFRVKR